MQKHQATLLNNIAIMNNEQFHVKAACRMLNTFWTKSKTDQVKVCNVVINLLDELRILDKFDTLMGFS